MTQYPRSISSVSYTDAANRLQTLDIWLPRPLEQSDPAHSIWIVYVHGGAWRDPTQTSTCIEPTLAHLLSPTYAATLPHIAGIASLNYTLSPYPSHASDPSSPSDATRNATHPQHVRDIGLALRFLQSRYGMQRWVGAGHSCGATLLLQLVAGIGLDAATAAQGGGPAALVLTAGIYNVPLLLANHAAPACPSEIARIYADIVEGAFGTDPAMYRAVSPVAGRYGAESWPEGRLLVLGHSYEDELVERAQRDVMCVTLDREGWGIVMEEDDEEGNVAKGGRVLEVRDLKGSHDWVWEDGEQVALLLGEVVTKLVG